MVADRQLSRRRVLTSLSVITLAGCGDRGGTGETGTSRGGVDQTSTTERTGAPETTSTNGVATNGTYRTESADGPFGRELDLREANVVGVSFEEQDGTYTFDVTLHHDDEGEEGYANWWQVERLDGTRLGRRDLLHPHSQQPFTRSARIEVPDDLTCVVVRGHDETHGYGGVAVVVNLDSGATRKFAQGSEQRSFDAADCPK